LILAYALQCSHMDKTQISSRVVDWLVHQRLSLGITQDELANTVGLHQTQISKIENKIKQMDLSELFAICDALELDPKTAIRSGSQNDAESILERWEISEDELTEIVDSQPSLRGMMLGYVAEFKLAAFMDAHDHVSDSFKHDDHSRTGKGDRVIQYKGQSFIIECKSLQTNSIKEKDGRKIARAQVDASDKRPVELEDGSSISTTCLKVGEFDILAVNTYAFGNGWSFQFAKNTDLPRSRYRNYSEIVKKQLLATTVVVSETPEKPFTTDLFELLDELISGQSTGELFQ
jgi:transcriptional regulator with XRE-family HTH domain